MPSNSGHYYGFWEADPRKWERCCKSAATQMISEGWHPKAAKFHGVQHKRARKLWAKQ